MTYTHIILVGPKDAEPSGELLKAITGSAFRMVSRGRADFDPKSEIPLTSMFWLDKEQYRALADLGVKRLSDFEQVAFAPAWRILRSNFEKVAKAMAAARLEFTDLDPGKADCPDLEAWHRHKLSTRIAHPLLREGINSTAMLRGLTNEDLQSIRTIGDAAMSMLAALREKLNSKADNT